MLRRDWALLAIAAGRDKGLSPVQLQKTLFLAGQNLPVDEKGMDFYRFEPYNYGPFDADVYQDAEALAQLGLVEITRTAERRWPLYRATDVGCVAADGLRDQFPSGWPGYIERVAEWTQGLSFRQLVKAIYARYPQMRERSVFQG